MHPRVYRMCRCLRRRHYKGTWLLRSNRAYRYHNVPCLRTCVPIKKYIRTAAYRYTCRRTCLIQSSCMHECMHGCICDTWCARLSLMPRTSSVNGTYFSERSPCTHARTQARTHARTHACAQVRPHPCTHACTQAGRHAGTRTHARTHSRTHVPHARNHTCMHALTHTRMWLALCREV